jgi:hypothetical protein
MHVSWGYWRPWDQTQAIANARIASTELSRSRAEREEVDIYMARDLENRTKALQVVTAGLRIVIGSDR